LNATGVEALDLAGPDDLAVLEERGGAAEQLVPLEAELESVAPLGVALRCDSKTPLQMAERVRRAPSALARAVALRYPARV
jgi:hypothetical protein